MKFTCAVLFVAAFAFVNVLNLQQTGCLACCVIECFKRVHNACEIYPLKKEIVLFAIQDGYKNTNYNNTNQHPATRFFVKTVWANFSNESTVSVYKMKSNYGFSVWKSLTIPLLLFYCDKLLNTTFTDDLDVFRAPLRFFLSCSLAFLFFSVFLFKEKKLAIHTFTHWG